MDAPMFTCDGCGRQERGTFGGRSGGWHKPHDWYSRTVFNDRDWPVGEIVSCSRRCIDLADQKAGKSVSVLPW